jgi:hypothetical protein
MDSKGTFFDDGVRPHLRNEFALMHDLSRTLD